MSNFVVYVAMSLDGCIADENGDVHWLEAFDQDTYGYEEFLQSIGSIIMGRVTHDQIQSFGEWPYKEIPTLVWSGSQVEDLSGESKSWSENIEQTVDWLKERAGDQDVWILGGKQNIHVFRQSKLIDRWDIFVMPVLLGRGIRLFDEDNGEPELLTLEQVQPYANGVVKVSYAMR